MAVGAFRVGQRLRLFGEECRVHRDLGNGEIVIEQLSSGRYEQHRIPDLLKRWEDGTLAFHTANTPAKTNAPVRNIYEDVFHQSYSAELIDLAKAKLAYVTRLERLPRTESVMAPLIQGIWKDKALWKNAKALRKPPHFTSVARWIRSYEKSDRDLRALIGQEPNKGNGDERVHEDVRKMVTDALELEYLTPERPPLSQIRRNLKGQIALRNKTRLPSEQLTVPSYGYLRGCVQAMPAYDVHRARYGQRAADIKFRSAGSNTLAQRPLARASMDHTQLDLFVIDEETCLPLGRPWLTLVIDEYARYVLGYYVGFESPSNVSMSRALRHAIWNKSLRPDTKGPWDAWGVIDTLVVDNGMEFHGRALEEGASRYGIHVQFCPRRKPWFKGKIERFFGTLGTGLLAGIEGKTFSSITLKGDYDPAKNAVLTLQTLRKILEIWIVDVYHQEVHRGLGCTPQQQWTTGLSATNCQCKGACYCKVDRFLPASSLEIESAFSSSETRTLTHKGIEFDSILYNSSELGDLRNLHGDKMEVEIRIQDDDLGSIIVVSPDTKGLIRVPALIQEYAAGLTRWQHKMCKRFKRKLQEDDDREINLLEARQLIKQLIKEDMASSGRKSKTRAKQKRFGEQVETPTEIPPMPAKATPAVATAVTPPPEDTASMAMNSEPAHPDLDDNVPDFEITKNERRRAA